MADIVGKGGDLSKTFDLVGTPGTQIVNLAHVVATKDEAAAGAAATRASDSASGVGSGAIGGKVKALSTVDACPSVSSANQGRPVGVARQMGHNRGMSDSELTATIAPIATTAPVLYRKSRAKPKSEHKKGGAPVQKAQKDPNALKRRLGRPNVLTDDRKATVIGLIASGNFMSTAADYVGISIDVIDEALRQGRSAKSGPDHQFSLDVAKAHAKWTAGLVTATTKAARRSPEIALKMLSRRAKGWSDRPDVTVQHAGAVGSFDAAPKMAIAVRSDPASNAAFLELLGKLSESGAFDPGGALSDRPRDSGATNGVDELGALNLPPHRAR
ncbi:MAG: hypothetical protein NVSMB64_01230 [Candidatus Velthaea sp.]